MHKLVILVENPENESAIEAFWPDFLHWAEKMPELRREVTSRVAHVLYGSYSCLMIHELYFDSPEAARLALASPEGIKAGETLQRITNGKITLYLADHLEDTLENIQSLKQRDHPQESEEPDSAGESES